MGINKSNVRFVIHYDIPKNVESYYQQIGRAGRDGLPAHCLMLFGYGDIQKIKYFITKKDENEQRIANIHLNALVGFAEITDCRRKPLLSYFGEVTENEKCSMCDNCRTDLSKLSDITNEAILFFNCIKATKQFFGAAHIIDVLRGSKNQKIIKFQHCELACYARGERYSKKQWLAFSRQFLIKGFIEQDVEYGSLKLCESAYIVLEGNQKVMGKIEEDKDVFKTKEKKEKLSVEKDKNLFEVLRKKRKELADRANVPPYIIFNDKTLVEMTKHLPETKEEMLQINGVGLVKFEKFGQIFLDIIKNY